MRYIALLIAVTMGLHGRAAWAQSNCYPVDDRCAVPQSVGCCDSCAPPCVEQQGVQYAMPPGMYAQPPAVGELQGEQNAIGIQGPMLHIPEIRLELPTIRLPNFFRIKRGAEMRVDSARAPYMIGQAATFGMMGAGGHPLSVNQLSLMQLREQQQSDAQQYSDEQQESPAPKCSTESSQRLYRQSLTPPPAPASEEVQALRRQVLQQQQLVVRLQQLIRNKRGDRQLPSSGSDHKRDATTDQVAQMQAELAQLQQLCQKILATRETQVAETQQPQNSLPVGNVQYEVAAPTPPAIEELPAPRPGVDDRVVPASRDISDDPVDGETPFGELDADVDSLMSAGDDTFDSFGAWQAKRVGKAKFPQSEEKGVSRVASEQPGASYVAASTPERRSSLKRFRRWLRRR